MYYCGVRPLKPSPSPRAAALALCLLGLGCAHGLPGAEASDPVICARVKAALKADPGIDVRFLDVNSHMGIVTLSGIVDSSATRRKINRIVDAIPGVKQVILNLVAE